MSAISFYFQYLVLRTLAFLPFWILFVIADGLYIVLYYLMRYRLRIVRDNIRHAFPEKSELEKLRIEKAFYRHFADMLVECLKMVHMSPEELDKRVPLLNPEILDKYRNSDRSVVAVGAHYCNWEWTLGIVPHLKYLTIGVYKPLNNKRFDGLVNKTRSRFHTRMVNMREVPRVLIKYKSEKVPSFNVFIADQSPVWEEVQYWIPFLNQKTAVYLGPEKLAKQFDMVVLFGKVKKTGRGRYTVELIPVEENPLESPEFEITEKCFGILEEIIREQPEYWLWSHRRWKLTRRREKEEGKGIFRFSEENTRI
jgi:KDO2-lipid IV(A) lauroyltransferase